MADWFVARGWNRPDLWPGGDTSRAAETGHGTDTLTVTGPLPLPEVGHGADAFTVTRPLPLPEAGRGADALTVATGNVITADNGTVLLASSSSGTALLASANIGLATLQT